MYAIKLFGMGFVVGTMFGLLCAWLGAVVMAVLDQHDAQMRDERLIAEILDGE